MANERITSGVKWLVLQLRNHHESNACVLSLNRAGGRAIRRRDFYAAGSRDKRNFPRGPEEREQKQINQLGAIEGLLTDLGMKRSR